MLAHLLYRSPEMFTRSIESYNRSNIPSFIHLIVLRGLRGSLADRKKPRLVLPLPLSDSIEIVVREKASHQANPNMPVH